MRQKIEKKQQQKIKIKKIDHCDQVNNNKLKHKKNEIIASTTSDGFGEPAHLCSLSRAFTVRTR